MLTTATDQFDFSEHETLMLLNLHHTFKTEWSSKLKHLVELTDVLHAIKNELKSRGVHT